MARHDRIHEVCDGGIAAAVPRSLTLRSASRRPGLSLASVCGGRGRYSICRVRVPEAGDAVPTSAAAEAQAFARVRAGPVVHLACALQLAGPLRAIRSCCSSEHRDMSDRGCIPRSAANRRSPRCSPT